MDGSNGAGGASGTQPRPGAAAGAGRLGGWVRLAPALPRFLRLQAALLQHPAACAAALFIAMTAIVSAAAAWSLWDSRLEARRHAVQSLANVVAVLRRDVERNLEVLDLSLQGVADGLRTPGLDALPPGVVRQVLFDRAATAHDLGRILVLDRDGRVVRSSAPAGQTGESLAHRDVFRVHRDAASQASAQGGVPGSPASSLPFVGSPVLSEADGGWTLLVSRPLFGRDGRFAGAVVGSIKLAYVSRLFAGVQLGAGSVMLLSNMDGTLLARDPPSGAPGGDPGRALGDAALFGHARAAPSGEFDATSVLDGIRRLCVYQTVGSLPLLVSVAVPLQTVYAEWRQKAALLGVTGLLLCLLSCVLVRFALLHVRARLKAERQRQGERMQALGQLTAGVAHDFNNLLQTVLGCLEMIREKPVPDAEGRELAILATQAARRGATLTRKLLAFSGQQPLRPKPVAVPDFLTGLRLRLGLALGTEIRLELHIASGTWPIHADPAELESCLLHLAMNARDAMPKGGRLRILAENAGPSDARPAGLAPGDWVRLAVEDTGTGMDSATLARACEPFFTTKGVGKGSGLGLSMVQGFARQSGGGSAIRSAPGEGTVVELWLPRAPAPVRPALLPAVAPALPAAQSARVLVVDDEAGVRRALAMILTRAGHQVECAEGGPEALARLRAGEGFDLLLTDQSMPEMSGVELLEEALRLQPGLKAAVITGYDRVHGLNRLPGSIPVIHKPIERHALLTAVSGLLTAKDPAPAGALEAV